MRRFLVDALPDEGERVALAPGPAHHLLQVVRVKRGGRVELFDGSGRTALATLVAVEGDIAILELEETPHLARPTHPLHLLVGMPKSGAMDTALRAATEAGATDLYPVRTSRSTVQGDRGERWRRIVESAAQQCGRGDLPTVHPLRSLEETIAALPPDLDRRIALPGAAYLPPAVGPAAVLIGPEGGLTEGEVEVALTSGFQPQGLGRWTLRTETAAGVAVAMVVPRS
ncbi:MAG: 16S rRNA (uracil(1498)-N(3))-methyltransferase [Deltaproteobacteria bacterium]|nr:16S rRNA (uracil(1498)-N(3))-methyltransferase [Deltaproteobacteria bacterium]